MGISIFAAGNNKEGLFATSAYTSKTSQDSKNNKGSKSIFAGNLNADDNNNLELKRKLAHKRAMKILTDTFATEQDIDNGKTLMLVSTIRDDHQYPVSWARVQKLRESLLLLDTNYETLLNLRNIILGRQHQDG